MNRDELTTGKVIERSAVEIRLAPTESKATREFTAIGVPYGQRIRIGQDLLEEFAPGSIENADRALVLWNHRDHEVLGKLTGSRDTEAGFEVTARLSDTDRGREAYQLMMDEVIDRMSIGFQMLEYRVEHDEDTGDDILIHTKVRALEFSLVPFPAYDGAAVTEVRRLARQNHPDSPKENPVTDNALTRSDIDSALDPLAQQVQVLERSVSQLRGGSTAETDELHSLARNFRSIGDFLQKAAKGDDQAAALHRAAAAGVTSADVPGYAKESFLGTQVRFVDERRDVLNMFTRAVLPAKGMSLEYSQVDFDNSTFLIGKQPAELDALPGPSKVTFKTASAPVETYGGWTRLSRQVIERADLPYLDTVLRAMALEYARVTNNAVSTRLITELDARAGAGDTIELGATAADATIGQWASAIVDAGDLFADRGFKSAGLAVSSDIFKTLATKTATDGRPLLNISGQPGSNVAGTANLTTGDGELLRVPVRIVRGTAGRAFFWDPAAIEVRESANAPILLQDEDVIILGKDFSLYGYLAVTVPFANALVPVEFSV